MANIIFFNPSSAPVANRVVNYKRSLQAVEYDWRNDVVVYNTDGDPPDVKALLDASVPMSLWKVSGGTVVELTQSDKDAIASANASEALEQEIGAVDNSRIAFLLTKSPTSILTAGKPEQIL